MRLATLDYDSFDWDEGNTAKIEERVAIEILEEFFKQKLLTKEDTRHSLSEERFIAMGYTNEGRCFFCGLHNTD